MVSMLSWRGLELGWIERPEAAFEHRGEEIYAHVRPRGLTWVARITIEHIDSGLCMAPTPLAALDAAADALRRKLLKLTDRLPGYPVLDNVERSAGATGGMLISLERLRQIDKEGYTAAHDDMHIGGELVLAALCYASPLRLYVKTETAGSVQFEDVWPKWSKRPAQADASGSEHWTRQPLYDSCDWGVMRRLEKAGALIAAELDRLRRLRER